MLCLVNCWVPMGGGMTFNGLILSSNSTTLPVSQSPKLRNQIWFSLNNHTLLILLPKCLSNPALLLCSHIIFCCLLIYIISELCFFKHMFFKHSFFHHILHKPQWFSFPTTSIWYLYPHPTLPHTHPDSLISLCSTKTNTLTILRPPSCLILYQNFALVVPLVWNSLLSFSDLNSI